MVHGIQGFFAERERNARRISLLAAAFALVLLAALMLARISPIEQALNDPKRWGFEGPEQYVQRIQLEASPGSTRSLRDVGPVAERSVERGGAPSLPGSRSNAARPDTRPRPEGPGEALEDLLARSFARRADVPVVQSEDLIIEKLVRPTYPQHAWEQNIEGRVAVMALVDTAGRVAEVQVMEGQGEAHREFGAAATEAVWQCRFRPYRVRGRVHEVYAQFRFNFTIY